MTETECAAAHRAEIHKQLDELVEDVQDAVGVRTRLESQVSVYRTQVGDLTALVEDLERKAKAKDNVIDELEELKEDAEELARGRLDAISILKEGVGEEKKLKAEIDRLDSEVKVLTQDRDNWRKQASCNYMREILTESLMAALGQPSTGGELKGWDQLIAQVKADREFLVKTNAVVAWPKLKKLAESWERRAVVSPTFQHHYRYLAAELRGLLGADTRAGFKFYKHSRGLNYRKTPGGRFQLWSPSEDGWRDASSEGPCPGCSEISWDELPDNARASAFEQ